MKTFTDKPLGCCDCKSSFIFSADEQQFFADKALMNEPKRCPDCRVITRLKREGKAPDRASRVCCADCGVTSIVPFVPTGRKPVYCGACLRAKQSKLADQEKQLVAKQLVAKQLVPAG